MKKIYFLLGLIFLMALLTGCNRSKNVEPYKPQVVDPYRVIANANTFQQPAMSAEEFDRLIAEVDAVLAGVESGNTVVLDPTTRTRDKSIDVDANVASHTEDTTQR